MNEFTWTWVNRYYDMPNSPDEYTRKGDIEPKQCRWCLETRIVLRGKYQTSEWTVEEMERAGFPVEEAHVRSRRCVLPFKHEGAHR